MGILLGRQVQRREYLSLVAAAQASPGSVYQKVDLADGWRNHFRICYLIRASQ